MIGPKVNLIRMNLGHHQPGHRLCWPKLKSISTSRYPYSQAKSKANNEAGLVAVRFLVAFSQPTHAVVSSLQLIHGPLVSLTDFFGSCAQAGCKSNSNSFPSLLPILHFLANWEKTTSNSFPSLLPIFGKFGKTPPQRAYMRAGYDFASGALRFLAGLFVRLAGLFVRLAGLFVLLTGFFYFTKSKMANSWRWIVFLLDI